MSPRRGTCAPPARRSKFRAAVGAAECCVPRWKDRARAPPAASDAKANRATAPLSPARPRSSTAPRCRAPPRFPGASPNSTKFFATVVRPADGRLARSGLATHRPRDRSAFEFDFDGQPVRRRLLEIQRNRQARGARPQIPGPRRNFQIKQNACVTKLSRRPPGRGRPVMAEVGLRMKVSRIGLVSCKRVATASADRACSDLQIPSARHAEGAQAKFGLDRIARRQFQEINPARPLLAHFKGPEFGLGPGEAPQS